MPGHSKMTPGPSSKWLPMTVILILITVGASVFSGYWYVQLSDDTEMLRSSPKDDPTWGILQLNSEALKFADALHTVTADNTAKTRQNLSLRLDILYSRFDIISEVFVRYDEWLSAIKSLDIYPMAADIQHGINRDFLEIRNQFIDMDRDVQLFLSTPEAERLTTIRHHLDQIISSSSELASRVNQATNQKEFNIRENVLDHLYEFQWTLLLVNLGLIFFSATSLVLYVNAWRAEQRSRQAAIELKAASEAKSNFLSSMSHELRTPLNAIMGFAQLLEYDSREPLSKGQKTSVQSILRGGNHLLELINQVLELSKIEAGKISLNLEWTSARSIIDESLHLIGSRAHDEGIEIQDLSSGGSLPVLWTDSTRLTQALINLLSNAIKYNSKGGKVTLTCQEIPPHMFRIKVTDTGRGIPAEKQDDLFKPFERLGRESGAIEGTGIGLTITQQIIDLLNGQIGFESEVDKGSTFWIDVPIGDQTNEVDVSPAHPGQP